LGGGNDKLTLLSYTSGFAATVTIDGGADTDVIEASAPGSTWTITAPSAGGLAGQTPIQSFTSIEEISLAFDDNDNGIRVTQSAREKIPGEPLLPLGQPGSFQPALISEQDASPNVTISTAGGNDTVLIDSLQTGFTAQLNVNTGAGDDVVVTTADSHFAGAIKPDGGPGTDRIEDYTGVAE